MSARTPTGRTPVPRRAIRADEIGECLGLSPERGRQLLDQPDGPRSIRVGACRLVSLAELERWLAERTEAS